MTANRTEQERRRANVVIGVVIALMVISPLTYYTIRSDRNDERFAWRMFSSVRLVRCKPTFAVGTPPVPVNLYRTFHEAWVTLAQRGRLAVTEAMARKLCADHPGQPVRLELRCTGIDGSNVTVVSADTDQCKRGQP